MKKRFPFLVALILVAVNMQGQVEPSACNWKTWFIASGKDFRLPAPSSYKEEIDLVIAKQKNLDSAGWQQMMYWNAGAPGYRWLGIMSKLYMSDTSVSGRLIFANMLMSVAIYDAVIAAWDTKYAHNRPRPYIADKRIKALVPQSASPSYPCEYSVAAGVAVGIVSRFAPSLADSVKQLAKQLMDSRVVAGLAFPSDTRAGFDLGKKIAEKEIEYTKDYVTSKPWDGKMPDKPGVWKGKFAMFPLAGFNKTVILESSSQFRPPSPPDFAKEMEELKNFKQTFRSLSNAFFWASGDFWGDVLHKRIFENNLHLNAPRATLLHAISAIALYDAFIACWDAKYAYWGTRPNQYDSTFKPAILATPPFPGYPSGHATVCGVMGEVYSYLFPMDQAYFRQRAKDGAESRFQAGIHFRTDNEVGLELGRKIATVIIQKIKSEGINDQVNIARAE